MPEPSLDKTQDDRPVGANGRADGHAERASLVLGIPAHEQRMLGMVEPPAAGDANVRPASEARGTTRSAAGSPRERQSAIAASSSTVPTPRRRESGATIPASSTGEPKAVQPESREGARDPTTADPRRGRRCEPGGPPIPASAARRRRRPPSAQARRSQAALQPIALVRARARMQPITRLRACPQPAAGSGPRRR